jgi:Helix-loop-helix DNA-binding domain
MSPTGLPTPAASSEIQAKPVALALGIDSSFSLPPAAISSSTPSTRNSSVASSNKSPEGASYIPLSPQAQVSAKGKQAAGSKRKVGAAGAGAQQEYALPPPPTRSRKIIQMKPRGQQAHDPAEEATPAENMGRKAQPAIAPAPAPPAASNTTTTGGKRKQANAVGPSSAAGRKMARKTAHSLIERRRRSKMNEEFGVLKDMIPACTGQDMHKLAILQASIEYMRYLEKCLADLKSVHCLCPRQSSEPPVEEDTPSTCSNTTTPVSQEIEMQELAPIRQAIPSASYSSNQYTRLPSISPALLPLGNNSAHTSPYHGATPYPWPNNATASTLPSPAVETLGRHSSHSYSASFQLTSPAMSPTQLPEDHEVTAALLMLNADRRSWDEKQGESSKTAAKPSDQKSGQGARVFSVRDLLSE